MTRILDVYLHETYAGRLIQDKAGMLSFAYDEVYAKGDNPALSVSMPLQLEPYGGSAARAFFSGLLPDDILLYRLAKYLGVSEKNPFALLEIVGGECAGALALYPKGVKPPKATEQDVEILDNKKVIEILDLLKRRPLLVGEEGIRLSLAGAQNKIAVGVSDGKIALIKGTTPTTHVLKPLITDITDIKDSVHNEFFCMRLAKLIGIDVPSVEIHFLDEMPYFLVERYDRIKQDDGNHVKRLHQEDFCQALGIMPEIKYEREGGPSISRCQKIINEHSSKPALDQMNFLQRIIFNYIIGNDDAHGKNFSLLYKNKKPELSPAYDILSTAVYPDLAKTMAMKIGGKYKYREVLPRHWHRIVPDTVVARERLEQQIKDISKECIIKAQELKESLAKEDVKLFDFYRYLFSYSRTCKAYRTQFRIK